MSAQLANKDAIYIRLQDLLLYAIYMDTPGYLWGVESIA